MKPFAAFPFALAIAAVAPFAGCSSSQPSAPATRPDGGADLADEPVAGLEPNLVALFHKGDALFDTPFREADGLGPLYIRDHCGACHNGAARGPGLVQTMVIVGADGFTPAVDQESKLPFGHTLHPLLAAGAKTPLLAPKNDPTVVVGIRVGPPVFGRGYMEAVLDSEIERVEGEQRARTDGIHGRINRVTFTSEQNPDTSFSTHKKGESNLIGRFGLKARSATIDDFIAGAFQGDMGITSPMRPSELPNPDGLTDDRKPGIDIPITPINTLSSYVRTLSIPRRELFAEGQALFDHCKCSVCHVPVLKTRADYPIAQLAGIDAAIYTDFLLHDWGIDAADGMTDQQAGPRMWRTAALIGLRFNSTFLHDGRAGSIEEAIEMHASPGSEPDVAARIYFQLTADERKTLVRFVSAL